MESIRDLWNSVRLSLLDRLSNPLLGAFCIAWTVWNFRIVITLLGAGAWREKIDYIDKVLMTTAWDWAIHAYAIPLAVAAVYVFLLPPLLRKVTVYHREQAAITARAVMIADGEQPISEVEASRLLARIRALSDQWEEERSAYLREIDELRSRLTTATEPRATPAPPEVAADGPDSQSHTNESLEVPEERDEVITDLLSQPSSIDPNSRNWPLTLGRADLQLLPASVAAKVNTHKFELKEIEALLAMRNWHRIEPRRLANALRVEEFDARVILDRLFNMSLVSRGVDGLSLNADGRMLTAYFKKIFLAGDPKDASHVERRAQ